jgi:HAD superfamily hydrolase (TIGR01549 family)
MVWVVINSFFGQQLSNSEIKAVIFDMDGVIIDSEPLYFQIQQRLFKELNISVSELEYDAFIGAGMQFMWEILSSRYSLPLTVPHLISLNNERIYDTFNKLVTLESTQGFLPLLTSIKKLKIKTAVASSTSKKIINVILSKLEIIQEFDVIVSSEEVPHSKPEPDIFLETAERLNVDPANCIVIEDSTNGVKAAVKAGMQCIGFANKNSGDQDLSNADIVVYKFSEINLFNT